MAGLYLLFQKYALLHVLSNIQLNSVTHSGPTLQPCGLQLARLLHPSPIPRACSNYVLRVSGAIQPSHSLLSPSPPAFILSQHQGLF